MVEFNLVWVGQVTGIYLIVLVRPVYFYICIYIYIYIYDDFRGGVIFKSLIELEVTS